MVWLRIAVVNTPDFKRNAVAPARLSVRELLF
jgi:hypothetical protein